MLIIYIDVPQLEPVIPQINPINSTSVQNIQPNVSGIVFSLV